MSKTRIGIYLRLRPARRGGAAGRVAADIEENFVEFNVPKDAAQGLVNNSKESYKFHFDGIFSPEAKQDAVFDGIARPAVVDALDGINCTVFAYGQTGSGKTFTVSGGTERYADRGLIPRTLAAIFAEAQKRATHSYSVTISYLELYNEEGYDLLDPTREVKRLEDLPKVSIMEDDDSRMHVRNLSAHHTTNEEEALNLLFMGDTNRMVAETPLNQASSRSHAIFTIQIEARKAGEDKVRRSKLHLVDLAGSERVIKTGIEGHALKEAKYINLSLHYLEQVIIALQEGRQHIPYRNSLLTQMLKDSLGGNCRTVMIANVAPETQHIEESISTCRFAQRVAMISNQVTVNEEVDPTLVIKRLKQENQLLRQELQLLKGGNGSPGTEGGADGQGEPQEPQLSEEERGRLRQRIRAFIADESADASLDVEGDMLVIRTAFSILKALVREGPDKGRAGLARLQTLTATETAATGATGEAAADGDAGAAAVLASEADEGLEDAAALASEVESLRSALRQKEQEVALLAGMMRKQGMASSSAPAAAIAAGVSASRLPTSAPGGKGATMGAPSVPGSAAGTTPLPSVLQPSAAAVHIVPFDDSLLVNKEKASQFEYFCASSPTHDSVQEHKALLAGKYDDAKGLGAQVNASKQRIGELKGLIEQRRVQRTMAALMQGQQGPEGDDPEEERAKGLIEKEKVMYRDALGQLKDLKSEIDQLHALLEHNRGRLQREFQAWYTLMLAQLTPEQQQEITKQQLVQQQVEESMKTSQLHPLQVPQPEPQGDWRIAALQPGSLLLTQQSPRLASDVSAGAMSRLSPIMLQQQPSLVALPSYAVDSPRADSRQHGLQPGAASLMQPSFSTWATAAVPADAGVTKQQPAASPRSSSRPGTARRQGQQQQQHLTELMRKMGSGVGQPGIPDLLAGSRPQSARNIGFPMASGATAVGGAGAPALPRGDITYGDVDPDVLAAARPLLTGNPSADADIIKFYQARAALLKSYR